MFHRHRCRQSFRTDVDDEKFEDPASSILAVVAGGMDYPGDAEAADKLNEELGDQLPDGADWFSSSSSRTCAMVPTMSIRAKRALSSVAGGS